MEKKLKDRKLIITPIDRVKASEAAQNFLSVASNLGAGYTPVQGWTDNQHRLKQLTLAYAAEIGIAKKLHLQWNGMATGKRQADVGQNIEVRWTSTDYAIVYEYDRDDDLLFLVKGTSFDSLWIAGFIPIRMAKVDEYKKVREGLPVNWWVPLSKLYTYLPQNQAVVAFLDRFIKMV